MHFLIFCIVPGHIKYRMSDRTAKFYWNFNESLMNLSPFFYLLFNDLLNYFSISGIMVKVIQINESLGQAGGQERYFFELIEGLRENGYDVLPKEDSGECHIAYFTK